MAEKRDWLSTCNDQNVPVNDFKLAFCDRCSQPECTRSMFGTTKFDKRVGSWEARLFSDVPRMDKKDPRYLPIAGSNFKMYDLERVPSNFQAKSQADWLDPRDLPELPAEETEAFVAESTTQTPEPELPSEPEPDIIQEVSRPLSEKFPTSKPPAGVRNLPHSLLLMNTPTQSKVLSGAPAPLPKADPWAGPVPTEGGTLPAAQVVKKGAKIKFGGSGVE